MVSLARALMCQLFLGLIAAAVTSWVQPRTDGGYQALFLLSLSTLNAVWVLLLVLTARRRT